MISECTSTPPAKMIQVLEDIVKDAREAYEGLERLEAAIEDLADELEETLCALGLK